MHDRPAELSTNDWGVLLQSVCTLSTTEKSAALLLSRLRDSLAESAPIKAGRVGRYCVGHLAMVQPVVLSFLLHRGLPLPSALRSEEWPSTGTSMTMIGVGNATLAHLMAAQVAPLSTAFANASNNRRVRGFLQTRYDAVLVLDELLSRLESLRGKLPESADKNAALLASFVKSGLWADAELAAGARASPRAVHFLMRHHPEPMRLLPHFCESERFLAMDELVLAP